MIVATSAFLRSSCTWTIVSICRIALSLCPRWWVLGCGVVYATNVDSNSTRLSSFERIGRRSSGGGDGGAVGTPSRHLPPQSRRAQLGVSAAKREGRMKTAPSSASVSDSIPLDQKLSLQDGQSTRTGLPLCKGAQPEQPELPWVQGGVKPGYWVVQASAQRIASERGSVRSKMRRSKVSKGAR
ncbi:hypothetical protein EDB89DRAFT_1585136 [Lactarius sanguifluus]|nr:hypothetical protein EDB89DRAFT_1585136 [Lactarius sanguifluus]